MAPADTTHLYSKGQLSAFSWPRRRERGRSAQLAGAALRVLREALLVLHAKLLRCVLTQQTHRALLSADGRVAVPNSGQDRRIGIDAAGPPRSEPHRPKCRIKS